MKTMVKNKEQKFYHIQINLIHIELKKWFKYKQYREDEKRRLEKLERKEKIKEEQHKQHIEKLKRKEKNRCINNLLHLLNLKYNNCDTYNNSIKINTKLILEMFTTNVKFDYQDHLKLIHFELKLKIKTKRKKKSKDRGENNFNNMLTTILNIDNEEVKEEVDNEEVNEEEDNEVECKKCDFISLQSLSNLPIVRVGCILRYKKNNTFYYILNKSNRNYLSDFGGGVSKNEGWKAGLYRELEEECPWMKEYIEMHIESEINIQLFLQKSKSSKFRGENDTESVNQLLILIDLYEEPNYLSQFYKTDEVQELIVLNSKQLLNTFKYKTTINYGILQLKKLVLNGYIKL